MERKEINLHNIPPSQRLQEIEKLLKRVRSLKTLRSRVCEYLHCGGSEVKEFHYKYNKHDWKGIIYKKRNSLMGSVFSLFVGKVMIIRGFPKILYTHNSKVKDQICIAEEKLDGTNIGLWEMPDGTIMGKTRMVERWDLGSERAGEDGSWKIKFEKAPDFEKVYELAKDGHLVYVELYGYKNKGEFVQYSVPYAYKVIGIVNRTHHNFLPRGNVELHCNPLKIPLPDIRFEGELSRKEVERIEFELEDDLKVDGSEGLVAKYWNKKDLDTYFCKLKTEKVKEMCYKISRSLIPAVQIRKAIRKAFENNQGETNMGVLLPFVVDELKEEYDESLLEPSMGKVKGLLRYALTPSDAELRALVLALMKEMNIEFDVGDPKNKGKFNDLKIIYIVIAVRCYSP